MYLNLFPPSSALTPVLVGIALSVSVHAQPGVIPLPYDVSLLKATPTATAVLKDQPAPQNGTAATVPFWVDMVNAEANHNGGDGIYVAVLDTGLLEQWPFFFPHARIKAEWGIGFTHAIGWNGSEFTVGPLVERSFVTDPFTGSGHGTHVTSTLVGYRFSTATADFIVRGVAPKVTIIPVLVLDAWEVDTGGAEPVRLAGGFDDMISAGIRYVADLATARQIKVVINMSLGGWAPAAEIEDAINYAIARGVIVVASAGNEGTWGMGWPGAYPQVISAAAGGWTQQWVPAPPQTLWWLNNVPEKLNSRDLWRNNWQMYLEEFSSRPHPDLGQSWKELDVCAPGASIVGPFKKYFDPVLSYSHLWGTSMAAPHVSALAACLAQSRPGLVQADAERVLKMAATRLPLAVDGAHVFDPYVGDLYPFVWQAHDYGTGWLTLDNLLKASQTR
ncbi:MAG: S8 family peptidase [Limisphaerales bacterium]